MRVYICWIEYVFKSFSSCDYLKNLNCVPLSEISVGEVVRSIIRFKVPFGILF